MKTPSKILILVLILLGFLASLAWVGVEQLASIRAEFDHVAQVDLVLMQIATQVNDLQLEKEIIFNKLVASAEELAFGEVKVSRSEYLKDYVSGLAEQFNQYTRENNQQMQNLDGLSGVPVEVKTFFDEIFRQSQEYDSAVQIIFKAVEKGGYQLSLDDLDRTDRQQKALSDQVKKIVLQVWGLVHDSIQKSNRWHQQSKATFWYSLLLTGTLGLLLIAFKKNLEEINRQQQNLEKLNLELDRFVHTVSHDIAGPLTTIVGYGAYLDKHYAPQLDQQGKDCINGLRKGATRLNVLVKDMLELTKMSKVKNPYSKVLMAQVIDNALSNCDFMVRQSSAKINIEGVLPEIVCDSVKMTAVFFNLISNGIKFSKPNEKAIITISSRETPRDYEFYVKDNGIGIAHEHHQEIFEIFKRLHPIDEVGGSGVGLCIVKAAVEDHGGTIRVESNLGEGAIFIFTIPKNLTPTKPLY